MKHFLLVILLSFNVWSQPMQFYYSNGKKIPIVQDKNSLVIIFNETIILEKIIPHAKPNDTLWINSKGETKKLNDWSQVFIIKFEYPKNLEEVIHRIKKMTEVEYVEAPVQLKYDETPNDLHYSGNQWYLTKIQAENAWNISKGNSAIRIAIVEGGGVSDHNDVNNKFISGEAGSNGDHGIKVAGVAALIFTCG